MKYTWHDLCYFYCSSNIYMFNFTQNSALRKKKETPFKCDNTKVKAILQTFAISIMPHKLADISYFTSKHCGVKLFNFDSKFLDFIHYFVCDITISTSQSRPILQQNDEHKFDYLESGEINIYFIFLSLYLMASIILAYVGTFSCVHFQSKSQ